MRPISIMLTSILASIVLIYGFTFTMNAIDFNEWASTAALLKIGVPAAAIIGTFAAVWDSVHNNKPPSDSGGGYP